MRSTDDGYTIIEVIVTVVIATMFLIAFFNSYMVLESQRYGVARQATASDIAYSNLRKFTTPTPSMTCDISGVSLSFTPEAADSSSRVSSQDVRVYPVHGCSDTNGDGVANEFTEGVLKIESTVTYDGGKKVVHASFIR